MPRPPVGKRLIVVEQRLAKVEQVAMSLAIAEDLEQGRRPAPFHQGVKGVVHRRLLEPLAQTGHLLGARLQPGDVLRLLEP